jgi:excinuclease ABC subunit C
MATEVLDDEFLASLPTTPGVYIMKDAAEKILYVGKALNLRSRVRSYFREGGDKRFIIPFLRSRVTSIETVITDTEKEALLLENTLIKKYKPRYNISLRDDKTYISLRLDITHRWPRLHRTRRRKRGDKALYFGPYSSASAVKETIRFLQRLFPIRSCGDRELENRARPCVLHQIDRCCAPCVGKVDEATYRDYVEKTLTFLKGKPEEGLHLLRAKMEEYSEQMLFEKAAMVRDRIKAMEGTVEEEKVHSHRLFDRDVVAMARGGGRVVFSVLPFRQGRLESPETFEVRDTNLEEGELLEGFLSQFYDTTRAVPRDVLVPHDPSNREFLEQLFSEMRGGVVSLRVPQRGARRRLLEMARQNADALLQRLLTGEKTVMETLENLRTSLHLQVLPRHVECLDISNFQGSFPVGSLVCFRDGLADKSGYRRFRIRTIEGQDDFGMIRECLQRHLRHVQAGEQEPPDLLVIDGGIGQLNSAVETLKEMNLIGTVPVVGLAKSRFKSAGGFADEEGKVRTEERVFLPGRKNPVTFRRSDPALHLLQQIRDETHRFGITYHRLLRTRSALKTGLEDIEGVGPKRRQVLLKHLGSLARIKAASIEEIAAVPGIPRAVAEQVHAFFHRGEEQLQMWTEEELEEEERTLEDMGDDEGADTESADSIPFSTNE